MKKETKIDIYFSALPNDDLEILGSFIVGESWERIKRLNLCKPKKSDKNIVIIDLKERNGDITDTEFVSLGTAKWLIGKFWNVPEAVKGLEKMVSAAKIQQAGL